MLGFKQNILSFFISSWFLLPPTSKNNHLKRTTLKKNKLVRCKTSHKSSSMEMHSHFDSNAPALSNVKKERKSEVNVMKQAAKSNSYESEETVHKKSEINEQKINHAEVLSKTENIWSQENLVFKEEPLCPSPGYSIINSNAQEKEMHPEEEIYSEANLPTKKTENEENVLFCESAKCEDQYSTNNLHEKKSLDLEDQSKKGKLFTDSIERKSKATDSKLTEECHNLGNFNDLDKKLEDDSAYGSDESQPGNSPKPKKIELWNHVSEYASEHCTNRTIFESIFSDDDPECICGDSDCDMCETGAFQEFLNGVGTTKPRGVLQDTKKCLICHKVVLDGFFLLNRFGLLLNCNHPFCYHCIYTSCYRKNYPVSLFSVKCPICGESSPGIVSSSRWIQSKIKKENLFTGLKADYAEWKNIKSYFAEFSSKSLN